MARDRNFHRAVVFRRIFEFAQCVGTFWRGSDARLWEQNPGERKRNSVNAVVFNKAVLANSARDAIRKIRVERRKNYEICRKITSRI